MQWLIDLDWRIVVLACLTLGLAPFTPPHLYEKLVMLRAGTLVRPLDWFDLFFHAAPWLLLVVKLSAHLLAGQGGEELPRE